MDRLSTGPNTPVSTFYTGLKTYNASQIQSSFASTAFSCAICLEDRKGKGCIQMPGCGCVLYVSVVVTCPSLLTCSCVPCLSSGWTLAITEGSLENVFCPSVTCTKERAIKEDKTGDCGSAITASLVESVVGQGLRERWEWITENRKAETGGSLTPRSEVSLMANRLMWSRSNVYHLPPARLSKACASSCSALGRRS
jgi:E3 ubiquitin-protein ligase RNF14